MCNIKTISAFFSEDELQGAFKEKISIFSTHRTCTLPKNPNLTQIHDEALINIKKSNRTTHVKMSNS